MAEILDEVTYPTTPPIKTLLSNVLVPNIGDEEGNGNTFGYTRKDILLDNGKIAAIEPSGSISIPFEDVHEVIDSQEKMILPGFVNAHAHSSEHWVRGLIKPLPLELWLLQLVQHEPRGMKGWYGENSFAETPSWSIGLSALHAGVEAMLSGCTAIMDHLYVRNLEDIEQAVKAYKALGIRAFIAPMLDDDSVMYANYIPLVPDAKERNEGLCGSACPFALGKDGKFRTEPAPRDPEKTKSVMCLWEEAVNKFHDPENGIEIAIGPVTLNSCSPELLRGAADLRRKYNLCGHTHLLETRAEALMAKLCFPSGSAVKHLRETGFLDLRGTSCAHSVWLTDEELEIMAESGAVCVHNPLSNVRLGSGVMPVQRALELGVTIAVGCDGACSSDGQDMLEALKLATTLSTVGTPEYRNWLPPQKVALTLGAKNGYAAVGMRGLAGEIQVGMAADLTLWDLTSLALLPRTDPLSLLVLGSRTQAPHAGSTLHTAWVRGRKVVSEGHPSGVNLRSLRSALMKAQPSYREPEMTNPTGSAAEVEYRAAMGLNPEGQKKETPRDIGKCSEGRVLYDSTIL